MQNVNNTFLCRAERKIFIKPPQEDAPDTEEDAPDTDMTQIHSKSQGVGVTGGSADDFESQVPRSKGRTSSSYYDFDVKDEDLESRRIDESIMTSDDDSDVDDSKADNISREGSKTVLTGHRRRVLIAVLVLLMACVALAVGLGLGLNVNDEDEATTNDEIVGKNESSVSPNNFFDNSANISTLNDTDFATHNGTNTTSTSPPSISFPPNATEWPHLMGWTGPEAQTALHLAYGPDTYQIFLLHENDPATRDYRYDRIRLFVDDENIVSRIPRIG